MAGTSVRIIKGLRLRSPGDDYLTVEEFLEQDRRGDNQRDNQRDNLKTAQNKEGDKGVNLHQINKEEKINLLIPLSNQPIDKTEREEKRNNPPLNLAKVENKAVNSVTPKEIDYADYPYDSSSEKKIKERAETVKGKILGCSTSNELIELKISEREIDWLKKNVLTQAEREQVKEIEVTRQGNLFSLDAEQEVVYSDFNEVMGAIDLEMRRLNWSKGEGKDYLIKTYGVKSRLHLKDEQLIEFLNYLKQQ